MSSRSLRWKVSDRKGNNNCRSGECSVCLGEGGGPREFEDFCPNCGKPSESYRRQIQEESEDQQDRQEHGLLNGKPLPSEEGEKMGSDCDDYDLDYQPKCGYCGDGVYNQQGEPCDYCDRDPDSNTLSAEEEERLMMINAGYSFGEMNFEAEEVAESSELGVGRVMKRLEDH
ncbi:MAG: hypothetical protein WCT18_03195 [Patescibacteria group bacterium]